MRAIIYLTILCSSVAARIVVLAGPKVISPNTNITVSLITENYIQSVADQSVAFSVSPVAYSGYLGDLVGSFYLGPALSNVLDDLNFTVRTPSYLSGVQYINAAVTSLYGANHGPVTIIFNLRVETGNATSAERGTTTGGANACQTSPPDVTSTTAIASSTAIMIPITNCCAGIENDALQLKIQASLVAAGTLMNDIAQRSNATVPDDLKKSRSLLDGLVENIVLAPSGCVARPSATWPPLSPRDSEIRVMQMLGDITNALQALQVAILRCDIPLASSVICQVKRLFENASAYWRSS